jgi:uncharacterized lipoprotein YmbA
MKLHRQGIKDAAVVLALSTLAACVRSPPMHFFALDPIPPAVTHAPSIGTPVRVDVVHVPPDLDRASMVRETNTNQLQIDDQNRWAGSLAALFQQALSQDLTARLPAGEVVGPDAPYPPGTRTITVDVLRFQPMPSGDVVLEGSWILLDANSGNPVIRRQVHLTVRASEETPASQAAAMSHLIAALADSIVDQLAAQSARPRQRRPQSQEQ